KNQGCGQSPLRRKRSSGRRGCDAAAREVLAAAGDRSAVEGSPAQRRSPQGRHRTSRIWTARSTDRIQEGIVRHLPGDDGANSGPRRQVSLEDRRRRRARRRNDVIAPARAVVAAAAPAADVFLRLAGRGAANSQARRANYAAEPLISRRGLRRGAVTLLVFL